MLTEDDVCNVNMMTEEEKYNLLKTVIIDYDRKESNLIQILHMAQAIFSFLPTDVQCFIADQMGLSVSYVNSVLTFYSFFSTKPKGEYNISVCLGTACYVRGGKEVLNRLKDELGIDVGETTADKRYSLTVMRCIGSCGLAPAMIINGKVYKQVNPNRIKRILGMLK